MRLLVGAAVRNYQSSAPFPLAREAERHKGITISDDNQAEQDVLAGRLRVGSRLARELNPVARLQPVNGGSDQGSLYDCFLFSVRRPSVRVVKCPDYVRLQSHIPKPCSSFSAGDKLFVPTVNRHGTIPEVTVLGVECVAGELSAL